MREPVAIMVHVPDPDEGLAWYEKAFPDCVRRKVETLAFEYLDLDGVRIEVVRADRKVSSGAAGTVVYWLSKDFEASLAHLLSLGATLYRGPMEIEDSYRMCQVQDPWGNCIGIRGRSGTPSSPNAA